MDGIDLTNKINNALRTNALVIPDGHKIAVITSLSEINGKLEGHAALGMKLGNNWHFGMFTDINQTDGLSAGLNLVFSK